MIIKREDIGYLFSLEQKGGPGSGIVGHVTPPKNGSGGKNASSQKYFESLTLPLRSSLKLNDQVVFMDKDNHVVGGVVAYGGKEVDPKTHIAVSTTLGTFVVPRAHLRMPKGGFRTRGE